MNRDLTAKYKDLLRVRIIGPDGEEWYQDAIAVPRVGELVTVWNSKDQMAWLGEVSHVTWAVPENAGGMVVIVQTKPES